MTRETLMGHHTMRTRVTVTSRRKIKMETGYASHSRVHQEFVFPIPDNVPSEEAGTMMCAGLTTYSPLVRAGVGPGKKVAVVGIGGLKFTEAPCTREQRIGRCGLCGLNLTPRSLQLLVLSQPRLRSTLWPVGLCQRVAIQDSDVADNTRTIKRNTYLLVSESEA
jgi:hypothetical protein